MLTPAEISGKEFEKVFFGGYDITGVDELLEAVTADYTALYKENGILKNKLKVLVEKIEEYRSTEDAMRMALLTAQKMGDDLVAEAENKKTEMLAELEMSADMRRAEIDAQLKDEKARLNAAISEREKFVAEMKLIIDAHLSFLAKIESIKHMPEPAAPAPTREETILSAARQIDSAVDKAVGEVPAPDQQTPVNGAENIAAAAVIDDDGDPTRTYMPKAVSAELEETSPRPKFDFDNLKFGVNFEDS
ncbi:MAG: DivIVA domain-containing protein [Clostridiales bacterium]|nr:DivIVA domain-containing protein [Clostridiales bacterium]